MISLYTFTLGRYTYLNRLINSIERSGGLDFPIKHYICYQGRDLPKYNEETAPNYTTFTRFEENIGIAEAINRIVPALDWGLSIKIDDDCIIQSPNFFEHVYEIHKLKPNCVFSPYPVGLINNAGGPKGYKHEVIYSHVTDTFYTLRYVHHIGGLCRITPTEIANRIVLQSDRNLPNASGNEDMQHSVFCNSNNIPMFYLENTIIVEHQESTLGQHTRYGEAYFKGRF